MSMESHESTNEPGHAMHGEPIDVLVVDDVPQNLLAMEALLARPGLRVVKASSGPEALEILLDRDVALSQAPGHTKTGFLVPSPQA